LTCYQQPKKWLSKLPEGSTGPSILNEDHLRPELESVSGNDVRVNIVVDVVVILVGSHDVFDVIDRRRLVERHPTRPELADRLSQLTSFRRHEVDVVRHRKIMTQAEADVGGDVLLILSDVLVAGLDDFVASCGAFPWKSEEQTKRKELRAGESLINFD
jgi:hypothetical protein